MGAHNIHHHLERGTPIATKSANYTVTPADNGTVFLVDASTDAVMTLPSTSKGLHYTFVVTAVGGSTGLSISPAAADSINGGTDDKDLINTAATDVIGDSVTVIADGSNGWYTTHMHGIWAAEA